MAYYMNMPKPSLVDVQAHICDPVFELDRSNVLARARRAGVDAIVVAGETFADARRNLELVQIHPMLQAIAQLKSVPEAAVIDAVADNTQRLHGQMDASA